MEISLCESHAEGVGCSHTSFNNDPTSPLSSIAESESVSSEVSTVRLDVRVRNTHSYLEFRNRLNMVLLLRDLSAWKLHVVI